MGYAEEEEEEEEEGLFRANAVNEEDPEEEKGWEESGRLLAVRLSCL